MDNDKLRVKFLSSVLYVRKVLINPDVEAAHQRLMKKIMRNTLLGEQK
jgi:hypothetical protein